MAPFRAVPVALALILAALGFHLRAPQTPTVMLLDTAVLAAPRLDESSGLVASLRRPGVFWTHNDSGDGPFLYATDSTGADLGRITVRGAASVDWEDIDRGPCLRTSGTCLYIGDIGDNRARRRSIAVYTVPEPLPPRGPADTLGAASVEDTLTLRYPDQPHDAEALAVWNHSLLLVTKDRFGPARLFQAPLTAGVHTLEPVADLDMRTSAVRGRVATGATVSADRRFLLVRTYMSLHLFALHDGHPLPLTSADGLLIPVVETQGEGVCFDAQGRIILAGERGSSGHAILVRLRLLGLSTR